MTLVNALETLKEKGITHLAGLSNKNGMESNIDIYIKNAKRCDEDAERYAEQGWAQYHKSHADNHFIVEINGYHIIATHYDGNHGGFDMVTYSDYETEKEASEAFDEWKIARDAEAIADEMVKTRPGELPHVMWVMIAVNELRNAKEASHLAFESEFSKV